MEQLINKLLDMGMGQFMDHSRQDDMPFELVS